MSNSVDGAHDPERLEFIYPQWSVSPRVHACTTTRVGGVSTGPYAGLNLATHVGDDPGQVAANRQRLVAALNLPAKPLWLEQVHGTEVLVIDGQTMTAEQAPSCSGMGAAASVFADEQVGFSNGAGKAHKHQMMENAERDFRDTEIAQAPCADASLTHEPGHVCAVLTADCLPVLLCERHGRAVAAAHAGWRGLLAGVIERTVEGLAQSPENIAAWLGPAIGPRAFEVGPEVREAFLARDAAAAAAFKPSLGGAWLADLYSLARQRLAQVGVNAISGGDFCTFSDPARFYSYRLDGRTGRMASLIWLEP
jgi:YfiH family protein